MEKKVYILEIQICGGENIISASMKKPSQKNTKNRKKMKKISNTDLFLYIPF